ncbi:MAG TPA: restriction endonuclease subunit S [Chitinophagaceae bacterium]|jgi:type I restriction enzyme S subunit
MSWNKVKLGDVCEIYGGTTPATSNFEYWNGSTIWLSPTDLPEIGEISNVFDSERRITEKAIRECSLKIIPTGSVVYSTRASIGKIGIAETPLTTNQGFANFICNGKVFNKFLCYALKYYTPQISKLGNSTTFAEVSRTNIRNFFIPLPAFSTQQKIAAILDKADELRRKDKALLARYDALLQSIFYKMFGDPVKNEKGWEKGSLSKILFVDRKIIKPNDFTGNEIYIGLEHLEKETGEILDKSNVEKAELKSTKFIFSSSHILYGKLRPYLNKVSLPDFNGICSTDILPVLPKEKLGNKYFIGALLRQNHFVDFATKSAVGANLPRVNANTLEDYVSIHPPITLQNQFAAIAQNINQQKFQIKQKSEQSDNLFQSLLQKAFKGELVK